MKLLSNFLTYLYFTYKEILLCILTFLYPSTNAFRMSYISDWVFLSIVRKHQFPQCLGVAYDVFTMMPKVSDHKFVPVGNVRILKPLFMIIYAFVWIIFVVCQDVISPFAKSHKVISRKIQLFLLLAMLALSMRAKRHKLTHLFMFGAECSGIRWVRAPFILNMFVIMV